jgi:hypothetical protein
VCWSLYAISAERVVDHGEGARGWAFRKLNVIGTLTQTATGRPPSVAGLKRIRTAAAAAGSSNAALVDDSTRSEDGSTRPSGVIRNLSLTSPVTPARRSALG